MNGSSEREAISRRYADNETDLDVRSEDAKSVTGIISENSSNSCHSERQRKNPADYCNTIKLKGIHMDNLSETDHASTPLGIFASKT